MRRLVVRFGLLMLLSGCATIPQPSSTPVSPPPHSVVMIRGANTQCSAVFVKNSIVSSEYCKEATSIIFENSVVGKIIWDSSKYGIIFGRAVDLTIPIPQGHLGKGILLWGQAAWVIGYIDGQLSTHLGRVRNAAPYRYISGYSSLGSGVFNENGELIGVISRYSIFGGRLIDPSLGYVPVERFIEQIR
jgi:hypothetical protein